MIETLATGLRLVLPSGNVIVLVRRERTEWICEYTEQARARGEVIFSGLFLRTYARRV
jgi:hypothetical protein